MSIFSRFFLSISLMMFAGSCLHAEEKEFLILRSRKAGFFSIFFDVLSLLKQYETGKYAGVEVDFSSGGFYYCPAMGNNWWTYYFHPICIGLKNKAPRIKIRSLGDRGVSALDIEERTTRSQASDLIKKYVFIKPDVWHFVENFSQEHFAGCRVIAVHYRGTDKICEAPRVAYKAMGDKVAEVLASLDDKPCKVFIASDEKGFIDFMEELFPGLVCYNSQAIRSENGQAIHLAVKGRGLQAYRQGFDALVDCLLLAKGDILLRTSSNLSLAASYFNPDATVIELSTRH